MIPNNQRVAVLDNHLDGERIQMGFDEAALVHLMTLLTDLYSDPQGAVIREYSTNAWDSHIDAGNTQTPIEVTTPNNLDPYFKVKDYGIGMNADDIRRVYSLYGASTKRQQTTTNGSMGIGAKSALTISNQFMVVGVKHGIKTHVSVSRDSDGSAFMEIVSETPTTEPNGVEVIVPVRDVYMKDKAEKFFRYWEKGRVLLNGTDPSKIDTLKKVSDRVYFDDDCPYHADVVVMGNVGYPTVENIGSLHPRNGHYVAFVTMNGEDEVVFTPSREGLQYVEKTKKSLKGLAEEVDSNAMVGLQAEVDAATTPEEAFKVRGNIMSRFAFTSYQSQLQSLTYKGEEMLAPGAYFSYKDDKNEDSRNVILWKTTYHRYAVQTGSTAGVRDVSWIIVNYPSKTGVSGQHKRKIKHYIRSQDYLGKSLGNAIILINRPKSAINDSKWFDSKIIDWNDIPTIRIDPVGYSGGGRASENGGYMTIDPATMSQSIRHDVAHDATVVYWTKADRSPSQAELQIIARHLPNVVFVETPRNRHDKLERSFKNAVEYYTARAKAIKLVQNAMTDHDWAVLASKTSGNRYSVTGHRVKKIAKILGDDLDKVLDKRLAELVALPLEDASQNVQDAQHFELTAPADIQKKCNSDSYLRDNYPLVSASISDYGSTSFPLSSSELIDYFNMKFQKKGK